MRKPTYLIAAAFLAISFCADRALAASPALRPEVAQLAEKFVNRLSEGFSRTTATLTILPQRQPIASTSLLTPQRPAQSLPLVPQSISPFQFRLPPPAC